MYKERIQNLVHIVKDDPEDLEFIEERMNAFTGYVSYVVHMEFRMSVLNARGIGGEEWREEVQSMDECRKNKHDVCISAINQLNRMCSAYDLEPFYEKPVDDAHRTQIGDDIGEIVNEYFQGRSRDRLQKRDLMSEEDFAEAVANIPDAGLEAGR